MIILGIDPGVATTGYGIIQKLSSRLELIDYGYITTRAGENFSQRLKIIHQELQKIITKHKPQAVAVEELFFCKNVKTALQVGQARGVILLTIIQDEIPVYEYTPLQVKQAISSYGRASKNQVGEMVKVLLKMKKYPRPDDAADALAIAICCAHSIR